MGIGQWGRTRKCLKPERIYASCLTPGVTNSVWDCGRIVEDIHLDCPNISSTCLSLGNNGEIFNQVKVFYFLVFQSLDGESFLLGFFKVWLVNTPLSLSLRVSQKSCCQYFLGLCWETRFLDLRWQKWSKAAQNGPSSPR